MGEVKLTKAMRRTQIDTATGDLIEAATEHAFGGCPDDNIRDTVERYLRACGDDEMADNLATPAGRQALGERE